MRKFDYFLVAASVLFLGTTSAQPDIEWVP